MSELSVYRQYRVAMIIADARRRDRDRHGSPGNLLITTKKFKGIMESQSFRCYYTGVEFDESNPLTQVSIERLNNSLGYLYYNVVAVIRGVNIARGEASVEQLQDFLRRIRSA